MSKKKKTKTRTKSKNSTSRPLLRRPGHVDRELMQIYPLLDDKKWDEAIPQLEALHNRFSANVDVLVELVNACYDTQNLQAYLRYIRKVQPLRKRDGDLAMGLGGAYLATGYPFAAYHYMQAYLHAFPEHERAAEMRETVDDLYPRLVKLLADLEREGEEGFALGYLHDRLRAEVELGEYVDARQTGRELLEQYPDFVPALNNLSQVEFHEGNPDQALAYARQVLALRPDNFQASANLTRYLFLLGEVDVARAQAEHLDTLQSETIEFWIKKAEAFTYLGDHERVEAAVRAGASIPDIDKLPGTGLLYHLGAVAALSVGDEKLARSRWQKALKLDPHLALARENLQDLTLPQSERHAPWPYTMHQWLPHGFMPDLERMLRRDQRQKDSTRLVQEMQTYLQERPALLHLFAILLARGGQEGRELVMNFARFAKYPPLYDLLRDFAVSQDGPDQSRLDALKLLNEHKEGSAGAMTMWLQGAWTEILTLGFEIGEEGEYDFPFHNSQAEDLVIEATSLLRTREYRKCQALLEEARALEPDNPIILNNLAKSLEGQGDQVGAEEIMAHLLASHPNYLFAQIGLANKLITAGDLDRAAEPLNPLLQRSKLHHSEFFALADAEIRYQLALDQPEGAEHWLGMWRQIDPDHPAVRQWERRLGKTARKGIGKTLAELVKRPLSRRRNQT